MKDDIREEAIDHTKRGGNIDTGAVLAMIYIGDQLKRIADHMTEPGFNKQTIGEQIAIALRGIELKTG